MSENNQTLLEVKNLKQYFNIPMGMFKSKPLKAVDDVSFSIRKGETLADLNKNRHIIIQIESPKGYENLPAMLDAYGDEIASIVIGPFDFSIMI